MILICYDGSPDSRAAVEQAAALFADQPATVLTVWEPFVEMAARSSLGLGLVPFIPDPDEIDEASRKAAEQTAADGAALASRLGMTVEHRSSSQVTTTAGAILAEADAIGATAIVMGSRGLTGVKSLLLGSVSHEVVQHADRAVVVVPSPEVAASRARAAHQAASK
ncbi:MAG TPA: universal stress protein [Solirubrobacteraceae bacterium]|jgi:nucleotide-binding universal stress UspA family protein|nr:universal stress protein [Solirubrobacteraceae bacterium]